MLGGGREGSGLRQVPRSPHSAPGGCSAETSPRPLAPFLGKASRFYCLTQTQPKTPTAWAQTPWPEDWEQPRGCQSLASGLCLARKFLLGTEKWEPQLPPTVPSHTHTPSPYLTEASGEPQGLQGKGDHLTGCGQSSEPLVGKLPALSSCGSHPYLLSSSGGSPCTVNPQNLLALSGPAPSPQCPAS